ncbi:hypothetical protein P7366_25040, partial [Vibrio parahaemolyticus]|nr:hypothetical protein [Vibrio parahaemolyticus]
LPFGILFLPILENHPPLQLLPFLSLLIFFMLNLKPSSLIVHIIPIHPVIVLVHLIIALLSFFFHLIHHLGFLPGSGPTLTLPSDLTESKRW